MITINSSGEWYEDEVLMTDIEILDHAVVSSRSKLFAFSERPKFDSSFISAASDAITRVNVLASNDTVDYYRTRAINAGNCVEDDAPCQFRLAIVNVVNAVYASVYILNAYKGEATARSLASVAAENERVNQISNIRAELV